MYVHVQVYPSLTHATIFRKLEVSKRIARHKPDMTYKDLERSMYAHMLHYMRMYMCVIIDVYIPIHNHYKHYVPL